MGNLPERVIEELINGRDSAAQLQILLKDDDGSVLAKELSVKILGILNGLLSVVMPSSTSSDSGEVCQIPASTQVGSLCSGDRRSVDSGESTKRRGAKDRRGGYKRRKSSASRTKVSPTTEDDFGWRKYGQKEIHNAKFPRCYYRCTHKPDQGCLATKQVQKVEEEPPMYQTTYFDYHTCTSTSKALKFISDSDTYQEPYLLSFGQNKVSTTAAATTEQDHDHPTALSIKAENKEAEAQSEPSDGVVPAMDSMLWQDFMPDHEDMMSGFCSPGSTSSYGNSGMEFLVDSVDFDSHEFDF